MALKPEEIVLPVKYKRVKALRLNRHVRQMYIEHQKGLCYHCKSPLEIEPPKEITDLPIDWNNFPPGFIDSPQHLHHCHKTGYTIGVVHAYCNAVLWQYHDE